MREGIDCKNQVYRERQLNNNMKNIAGEKFFKLTVLFPVYLIKNNEIKKSKTTYWLTQCNCGNIVIANGSSLRSNKIKSCGCIKKEETTAKDLTGQKFGKLIVIEREKNKRNDNRAYWKCKCVCGNFTIVSTNHLTSGHTTTCGCSYKEKNKNNIINMQGKKIGKLLVLEQVENNTKSHCARWKCLCECGNITYVNGIDLRRNTVQSCGCTISRGEQLINTILKENNINFERQKSFLSCINPLTGKKLFFDFYINNQFLLEFDGSQHYKDSKTGWNTLERFKKLQERDNIKNQWCKENNIPLKRIPYWELDNITIDNIMDDTFLVT